MQRFMSWRNASRAQPIANPNLALLEAAAAKLKSLLEEVVFVGGCATGLLITDPAAAAVRKTYDVDIITEIASYVEYALSSERLRHLDFIEDMSEGAPICRRQSGEIKLDGMPLDEKILGFSNRRYEGALRSQTVAPMKARSYLGSLGSDSLRYTGSESLPARHIHSGESARPL